MFVVSDIKGTIELTGKSQLARNSTATQSFPTPSRTISAMLAILSRDVSRCARHLFAAAMTAVTMIFEMTRDYDIVMPMIVSVAISIGIRRLLSRENIYTIKLVSRRHFIPKALHANMFLVHQAADVMDRDVMLLPSETSLDAFVRLPYHDGRVCHVVVIRDEKVFGVVRINTALHHGSRRDLYWREPRGCRQPHFCHRSSGGNHVRGDRKDVEGRGHDGGGQPRKWYRSSRSGPWGHHQGTYRGFCGRQRATLHLGLAS